MVEAARGIGLTRWQVLYKVKLPMALPVIMAGVRISAVTAGSAFPSHPCTPWSSNPQIPKNRIHSRRPAAWKPVP